MSNPNFVAITTCRGRRQRLADELLVRERTVDLGGVEERDAALDRRPDQGDRLLLVHGRAVAEAHSHAAQAEGRDLQVALSSLRFCICLPSKIAWEASPRPLLGASCRRLRSPRSH